MHFRNSAETDAKVPLNAEHLTALIMSHWPCVLSHFHLIHRHHMNNLADDRHNDMERNGHGHE